MKSIIIILCSCLFFLSCADDGSQDQYYRQKMRDFVRDISAYAKNIIPGFIVIPQNGHDLCTADSEPGGDPDLTYLDAIDGIGREDLFYGYVADDILTPEADRNEMIAFLDIAEANGVQALVTDYCSTPANIDNSYTWNSSYDYISFAADHRELDNIPVYPAEPHNSSTADIALLSDAKNFLYLLDTALFATKQDFLDALATTDHDLLIIDLYFSDDTSFTAGEINPLKTKPSGGSRLVIAYMSIGEAENYRYYWDSAWETDPPDWMAGENPDWPGNYKVRYWDVVWQAIIFGNEDSYLRKIIDAGFDGVYLDIIDAYEYFE